MFKKIKGKRLTLIFSDLKSQLYYLEWWSSTLLLKVGEVSATKSWKGVQGESSSEMGKYAMTWTNVQWVKVSVSYALNFSKKKYLSEQNDHLSVEDSCEQSILIF